MAVLLRDDRFLVIQRAKDIVAGGAWCLPGGAIEAGETPQQAMIREMREELGLAIRPIRKLWQCRGIDYPNDLEWWHVEPETPEDYALSPNPKEVAEVCWLTPEETAGLEGLLETNHRFLREWPRVRRGM